MLMMKYVRLGLFVRVMIISLIVSLIFISACSSKGAVETVEKDGLVYESSGRSSDDFPAESKNAEDGGVEDSPFAQKAGEREGVDKDDVPPPPSFKG